MSPQVLQSPEIFVNIQTLFVFTLLDEVSGQALLTSADIDVSMSSATLGSNFPFLAKYKQVDAQIHAYYGRPDKVFPQSLPDDEIVTFSIAVSAPQYQSISLDVEVAASSLKTSNQVIAQSLEASLLNAPVIERNIALMPDPVALQGQVVEDNDPFMPAENAVIGYVDPSLMETQVTDDKGRFRFSELPTQSSIVLSIEYKGETANARHFVDFSTPLNQITVSVNG